MIIEAVVRIILGVVNGFCNTVLPIAGPLDLGGTTGWLHGYLWLNGMLPLSEALRGAVVVLGVVAVVFAFGVARTVWGMVKP